MTYVAAAGCGSSTAADTNLRVAATAGDGQTAIAQSPVGITPSVIVTDADNKPVAGVLVTFAVTSGGGTVTGGTAASDATGGAQAGKWTLGPTIGTQQLSATVSTGKSAAVFTATAIVGPVDTLVIVTGDHQTGSAMTALTTALVVRAQDSFGNRIANTTVRFQASAQNSLDHVQDMQHSFIDVTTDTAGQTPGVLWIPQSPGGSSLLARAGTGLAVISTFHATVTGGVPSPNPTAMKNALGH